MGWISGLAFILITAVVLFRLFLADDKKGQTRLKTRETPPKKSSEPSITVTHARKQTVESSFVTSIERNPISSPAKERNNQSLKQPGMLFDTKSSTGMPPPPLSLPESQSSSKTVSSTLSKSPPRLKPPTIGPAPPRPGGSTLMPPPSAASSLRVPQQRVLQNTSMQPSTLGQPSNKPSRQVVLEPGHSPLDWAALTSNPNNNLRGKDLPNHLLRVTPSQLKIHNGRKGKDAWTVYQGKVYNISPYVPFHPGGKGEILRGAAKDSAKLFMEVHPWVNWDGMLGECLVGILVGEDDSQQVNDLDEMD